ncbi:hydantoinase B/oxoprolinase family protein [Streptomyces sp. NPDC096311]|uniref:hydantoinase B/oxoprolinase family protein n=1 Tax=Streptomyces sp. NPDC096311 TaxID=3366083 RepID=UPI0038223D85
MSATPNTQNPAPARTSSDALEPEIFRYSVASIGEELEINITRTAYSPLVYECKDYSVGFLTRDFRLFAQSQASIPIFVSVLGRPVRDAVEIIGEENLDPGDVLVTNFSDVTGEHINNTILASPLYDAEGLVGYVAILVHWADLGGMVPGGISYASRSVFHEGTRYRGLRVMRRGEIVPEVLATIQANTWQKEALTGDLMSQVAACKLATLRWTERIASRWTPRQVRELIENSLLASAAYARRQVAAFPDGAYEATKPWTFQADGITVDLTSTMRLTIAGDRVTVDLSGLPPQTVLPINCGADGGGAASIRVAFKLLFGPDWPVDDGFFEPLDVVIPDGTIASAGPNAPICQWNAMVPLLIDLFLHAIGQQHPDLVPASHFASQAAAGILGQHPDGTRWMAHAGDFSGGLGADRHADGFGPVKNLMFGDFPSVPIEMIEKTAPVVVHSFRLRRDSGGAGLHRGGPGVERVTELLADAGYINLGEQTHPAQGLADGQPGELGGVHILPAGETEWQSPPERDSDKRLSAGSLLRFRSGGGGGWGAPPAAAG